MDINTFCSFYKISRRKWYTYAATASKDGVVEIPGHGAFRITKIGLAKSSPVDIQPLKDSERRRLTPPPSSAPSVPGPALPPAVSADNLLADVMTLTPEEIDRRKKIAELRKLCTQADQSREELQHEILTELLSSVSAVLTRLRRSLAAQRLSPDQIAGISAAIDTAINELKELDNNDPDASF